MLVAYFSEKELVIPIMRALRPPLAEEQMCTSCLAKGGERIATLTHQVVEDVLD